MIAAEMTRIEQAWFAGRANARLRHPALLRPRSRRQTVAPAPRVHVGLLGIDPRLRARSALPADPRAGRTRRPHRRRREGRRGHQQLHERAGQRVSAARLAHRRAPRPLLRPHAAAVLNIGAPRSLYARTRTPDSGSHERGSHDVLPEDLAAVSHSRGSEGLRRDRAGDLTVHALRLWHRAAARSSQGRRASGARCTCRISRDRTSRRATTARRRSTTGSASGCAAVAARCEDGGPRGRRRGRRDRRRGDGAAARARRRARHALRARRQRGGRGHPPPAERPRGPDGLGLAPDLTRAWSFAPWGTSPTARGC